MEDSQEPFLDLVLESALAFSRSRGVNLRKERTRRAAASKRVSETMPAASVVRWVTGELDRKQFVFERRSARRSEFDNVRNRVEKLRSE
jgi:hypothetical protein